MNGIRLVRAAGLLLVAACQGNSGPVATTAVAGTVTVDGKPRVVVECEPHYFDGVELRLHLDSDDLITITDGTFAGLYFGHRLRGDKLACSDHTSATESGGSTSGEGWMHGTIAYTCKNAEHAVALSLKLTCGSAPAAK